MRADAVIQPSAAVAIPAHELELQLRPAFFPELLVHHRATSDISTPSIFCAVVVDMVKS
jgi:hypothetical protein